MTVVIQPASNPESREHYRNTVENEVDLDSKRDLLGGDVTVLENLHGPTTRMWGVKTGKNDTNLSSYMRLRTGDTVVFTSDKHVIASGTIGYLFRNEALANDLWGRDAGQTWELMYTLHDVKQLHIPYSALRAAVGSSDRDNFQRFRVLDRAKSEGVLELLGIEVPEPSWDIDPGSEMKRTDLQRIYGGGPYGGIEPSAKTPNILLFTNPYKKSDFGYNFDQENSDGTVTYTGDGQEGPQQPDQGGNKAILEHRKTRRALRLFEVTKKQSVVRYIGEFELGYPDFEIQMAPDINGVERDVLVFNLFPVGVTRSIGTTDSQPRFGSVNRREAERGKNLKHERQIRASTTFAERQEIRLQDRYKETMSDQGFDTGSITIQIPDGGAPLMPDLVDFTNRRIIEVKSGTSRGYVREAIGQVLDYVFQVHAINEEVWAPAILLPGRPAQDLVDLVVSLKIELIWEDELGTYSEAT